jgi:hypothetical protein
VSYIKKLVACVYIILWNISFIPTATYAFTPESAAHIFEKDLSDDGISSESHVKEIVSGIKPFCVSRGLSFSEVMHTLQELIRKKKDHYQGLIGQKNDYGALIQSGSYLTISGAFSVLTFLLHKKFYLRGPINSFWMRELHNFLSSPECLGIQGCLGLVALGNLYWSYKRLIGFLSPDFAGKVKKYSMIQELLQQYSQNTFSLRAYFIQHNSVLRSNSSIN